MIGASTRAHAAVLAPAGRAHLAYAAFLAFIVAVYSSAAVLIPALERVAPGQTLIALSLAALLWAVFWDRRPLRFGLAGGGAPLYLFFLLVAASPAWSIAPDVSTQATRESLKYLAAFVVAVNVLDDRDRARGALAAIVLASLFPAIGAIRSYATGQNLVEGTRAAWLGVFANPNFLAYHLVVSTPLALALREDVPREARGRALRRAAWLTAVAIFVVAVFLTGSRGGALGLGAVLLLWLLRDLARGRAAVGATLTVGIAVVMTPGGPWDRAETQATLHGEVDQSAQGRIDAWRTATNIVEKRPALGVGAGAFVLAYDRYAPGDAGPARTAHNSFLMIAAELGLFALGLYAAALGAAFFALGRLARKRRASGDATAGRPGESGGALERGVQTALFGFVVTSITGGYAFTWPVYFLLGIGAALVAIAKREATA